MRFMLHGIKGERFQFRNIVSFTVFLLAVNLTFRRMPTAEFRKPTEGVTLKAFIITLIKLNLL